MNSAESRSAEPEHTGIDLAPMLDFVLNLLIFFIVTTSFVKAAGVKVDQPMAVTAQFHQSGNILVAIRSNGDIWMDRHKVDLREVRPLIERMHLERPDDTVIVIADKRTPAADVARVMDEVKQGGIKDVAIGAGTQGGSG